MLRHVVIALPRPCGLTRHGEGLLVSVCPTATSSTAGTAAAPSVPPPLTSSHNHVDGKVAPTRGRRREAGYPARAALPTIMSAFASRAPPLAVS
jgi:hypothetical protein